MPADDLPGHDALVADLRVLRERGLWKLRGLTLPALAAAAVTTSGRDDERTRAAGQERLLRAAVARLGDEEPGTAAQYLFGLVQGTSGRRPAELRERAAREFGLSPETFRKDREKAILARIADEILTLCTDDAPPAQVPDRAPDAIEELLTSAESQPGYGHGDFGPFRVRCDRVEVPVVVRWGSVEQLRDVDVVVSSENVYLEPARMYTTTLSGALRRAAAFRNDSGAVTRDVVAEELAAWVRDNGSPGLPFETGIVVATSPGRLAEQGIRRLYHPAVAVPQIGSYEYGVAHESVVRCMHTILRRLREERDTFSPPLRSFSLPLFGAGYGGLDAETSFARLWSALSAELTPDDEWTVHLTVLERREAEAVLRGLDRHR
jgi:hypothetical protein